MCGMWITSLGVCLMLALSQAPAAQNANGDSLAANVYRKSFLLYEPLVVEVTLHLEEPFRPDVEDPHEAVRQLGRLRRRLDVELRDQHNETVRKGLLCDAEFLPTESPAHDFQAGGLAFLQGPDRKGEFLHSELTGTFMMVIRDRGTKLESNALRITIVAPTEDATVAAQLFKDSFPGALMMILEQKADEKTLEHFERLASEYPETPYGKYALASLALIRWNNTRREQNDKGGQEIWGPVAADLAKAVGAFDGWHPLRGQALFRLSIAQVMAGNSAEARRTAQMLSTDFPTGELGHKTRQLLSELDTMGARDSLGSNTVRENSPE